MGGRSTGERYAIRADTTQVLIIMCKHAASHHTNHEVGPNHIRPMHIQRASRTQSARETLKATTPASTTRACAAKLRSASLYGARSTSSIWGWRATLALSHSIFAARHFRWGYPIPCCLMGLGGGVHWIISCAACKSCGWLTLTKQIAHKEPIM
jgi:hypothetical protein